MRNFGGLNSKKRSTIRQTGALLFAFLLLVSSLGAVPVRATEDAGSASSVSIGQDAAEGTAANTEAASSAAGADSAEQATVAEGTGSAASEEAANAQNASENTQTDAAAIETNEGAAGLEETKEEAASGKAADAAASEDTQAGTGSSEETKEPAEAEEPKADPADAANDPKNTDKEPAEAADAAKDAEKETADDKKEPAETKVKEQTLKVSGRGYTVTVAGKIPETAALEATEITAKDKDYAAYEKSAAAAVSESDADYSAESLAYARFFDITIRDAQGAVYEPAEPLALKIDLKDNALATEDVTFSAVHFAEGEKTNAPVAELETEVLPVETGANEITVEAEGFSVYGVVYYYTVDFYYTPADDAVESGSDPAGGVAKPAEYHMAGGSKMLLSELFGKLGIARKVSDIAKVEFTNESLVKFTKENADYRITSLKPFTSSEVLTLTFTDGEVIVIGVEDEIGSGTVGGCTWTLSDDGTLTISGTGTLPTTGGIGNPPTDTNMNKWWPWYKDHRTEVKKVVVEEGVKAPKDMRGMFHGLENLETADLTGMNAADLEACHDMFSECKSLTEITLPSDFAPDQAWRLCKNCKALTTINFGTAEKPFDTTDIRYNRTNGFRQFDTTSAPAFSGCENLTTLNMPGALLDGTKHNKLIANMTKAFDNANSKDKTINMPGAKISGSTISDYVDQDNPTPAITMFKLNTLTELNLQDAEIEMPNLRQMFHSDAGGDNPACPKLKNVDMTGAKFPYIGTSAFKMFHKMVSLETVKLTDAKFDVDCTNYSQMFDKCSALKRVDMDGDIDVKGATNMQNVFRGCSSLEYLDISGFGELPNITNMNGFLGADGRNCTALETLIIDNLNNSILQPRRGSTHDHASDGRMMFTFGDPRTNLPSLKTVSAKNSKVWFVKSNDAGIPGSELYLAANESDIYYLTNKVTTFKSDIGPTETIDSKRDWIDLIKDRYQQSSGADTMPDAAHNINYKDGHLNTNGAGFLAPGVYEIGEEAWKEPVIEQEQTFYRISNIENSTPEVTVDDDLDRIKNSNGAVSTNVFTKVEWDDGSKFEIDGNDRTIKNASGDPVITITYPDAAEDIYGEKHDVVVKINAVTFKDIDRIKETENVRHDTNDYVTDSYARDILLASTGLLNFRNYVTNGDKVRYISGGSGTYIDFDIEVKDALPNTSILFYMEDLDVPARQNYRPGIDPVDSERDWHFGDLPFYEDEDGYGNVWGSGSEGMILGAGNDINTLMFAEHTGLERINGNEIISTGGDPNTAWSAFSVRAAATGANYTWTSGVACDTYLLKQTDPPSGIKDVYVMPELLKSVSGSVPSGIYFTEYFHFKMEDAVGEVTDVDGGILNRIGYAGSLTNLVGPPPSLGTRRTNEGEYIYFGHLKLNPPKISPYKAAYVYKITEEGGSSDDDIVKYDEDTTYYMQIIVSSPLSDNSLLGGTKAEIFIGEKYKDGGEIYWDTDHYITIWARDMQPAYITTVVDGKEYTIYDDGNGTRFYKKDDKFYNVEDNSEIDPSQAVGDPIQKTVDVEVAYPIYELDGERFYRKGDKCLRASDDTEFHPTSPLKDMVDTGDTKNITETFFVYQDANGKEFYRQGGKFWSADDKAELTRTESTDSSENKTVNYDDGSGEKTYTVYADHNGVEYFEANNGKYYTPLGKELIQARPGDVDPLPSDEVLMEVRKVDGTDVQLDVHGQAYIYKDGKFYDADNPGTELVIGKTLATATDATFNPHPGTDHKVYVEKKTGNGHTIMVDGYGVQYYEDGGKYYAAAEPYNELTLKRDGEVDPRSSDKPVKQALTATVPLRENRTGEGCILYETKDVPAIRYYIKDNEYYSEIGVTLDTASSSFTPSTSDQPVTTTVDVLTDAGNNNTKFYRIENNYYLYNPGADNDGSVYELGSSTVDTSDIPQIGTFNNIIKTSEISITKATEGASSADTNKKSGTFTYTVTFSGDFEPNNAVFDPAEGGTVEKADDWSEDNNAWTFTLHEGQTLTIRAVPFQTKYTVTEEFEPNGWEFVKATKWDESSEKQIDAYSNTVSGTVKVEKYLRTDDGQGGITISDNPNYKGQYDHTFTNRFTELTVDKLVRSTSAVTPAPEFEFKAKLTLTLVDGAGTPKANTEFSYGWMNGTEQQFFTATTDADGKFEGYMTFAPEDVKTFTLADEQDIALVVPKGATVTVEETAVTDWVTEVASGTGSKTEANSIIASDVADSPRAALHFTNSKIDPINERIPVEKILEGRTWKETDAFGAGLMISTADTATPMPEGYLTLDDLHWAEVYITSEDTPIKEGDKTIGYKDFFNAITYTRADIGKTYTYNVRELTPAEDELEPVPGVTYDESSRYSVEVTISLDESDYKKPKLTASYVIKDREGNTVTALPRFTNTYKAEQTIYKMEAVKDYHDVNNNTGITLAGGEFKFGLKPIGEHAAIAPMPKATTGTGANRIYKTANEGLDGDIEFEDTTPEEEDGLIFNYHALLTAGISDTELHSADGVDFEYEMWELIPGTEGGPELADGETLVNNNNGTWSVTDKNGNVTIYDGIHHTRMITVRVRTVTDDMGTPDDTTDDITYDELYIEGHGDDHKADFYIDAEGNEKEANATNIPGYDDTKRHFKNAAENDHGAPIFINAFFEQSYGSVTITKVWDDENDQDKIRPSNILVSIDSDEEGLEIDDANLTGTEWKATVYELPVYKLDLSAFPISRSEITYTIAEKSVPKGYTASYDPNPAEFTFSADKDYQATLTIKNVHTPEPGEIAGDETWGAKGEVQTGEPDYEKNPKNPVTPTNLVKPEAEGATISEDGKTVTIPGEGEYVLNDNGTITFTPEDDFVGDPTPVEVEGKDLQDNIIKATYTPHVIDLIEEGEAKRTVHFTRETKDGEKVIEDVVQTETLTRHATALKRDEEGKPVKDEDGNYVADTWGDWSTATFPAVENPDEEAGEDWYTNDKVEALEMTEPGETEETVIYYKKPAADEKKTYGGKGMVQSGTPPFEEGSKKITGYTLLDPNTGEPAADNIVTVEGEGEYELDPDTGEVTFTPEYDFIGPGTTVTVRATDEDGNTADGRYTPTVVDNIQNVEKIYTITYVYDDGSPVPDDDGNPLLFTFEVTFERSGDVDPETGAITQWGDWYPVEIPEVPSPEIEGYTPDKTSVAQVDGATPDNWPEDVVVTYTKNAEPEPDPDPEKKGPTWIEGSPVRTKDTIRKTQIGTLSFKPGSTEITSAKLIDPATGKVTDALTVDVYQNGKKVGTYTLDPKGVKKEDGSMVYSIAFVPEGDYTGTPPSITLRVFDENGLYADGKYQPVVVGSDPTPTKTVTPVPTVTKAASRAAKTGDPNMPGLWLALGAAAAVLLIGMIRRSRQ